MQTWHSDINLSTAQRPPKSPPSLYFPVRETSTKQMGISFSPNSSSSSSSRRIVLPNHKNLSPHVIAFLDDHFRTHDDVLSSSSSSSTSATQKLKQSCEGLEIHLANVRKSLGKVLVSWISRSIQAKTALHKLKTLGLYPTQQCQELDGIELKRAQKMLGDDMASMVKELRRIDDIRSYAETALKLEALVGALEDAVLSALSWHTGDVVSADRSYSSISANLGPMQEKLLGSIVTMSDIENVLVCVAALHPQWHHLMKSVDNRVDKTFAVFRLQVLADHRALLASLGWPPKLSTSEIENGTILYLLNPLVLMPEDKREIYSNSFLLLCALQQLQARREERKRCILEYKERNTRLWAIDELVSPIACRMEYHFSKWGNQPELIFALVYKITRDFVLGVEDVLQPLIDRARLLSYSAREAWVSAMVQMLSGFLSKNVFPVLAERYRENKGLSEVLSSWLHLIDLMVAFDRQVLSLVNTESSLLFGESERIGGLSRSTTALQIFCDRLDWLKIWAKIEYKASRKKLKAELKDVRVWLVNENRRNGFLTVGETSEFLFYSREDHKAPVVAEYALSIAWEMIEVGQNLPSILQRTQFIRSTSARFLWYFFNVLIFRCRRTEFPDRSPTDFLTRLCTSINSARYCESKLLQWSDEVSFLEMKIAEDNLCIHVEDEAHFNSSFFGEEIKSLIELETSWLMELVADLLCQFETLSGDYVHSRGCFEQEQEDFRPIRGPEATGFTVSTDLVEALDALRSQLEAMRTILNSKDFLDLWRSVADGLDHFIFCSILMGDNRFSDVGMNQFDDDMKALYLIFRPFCSHPEAFFPCLSDSLKLLKMNEEDVKHLWSVFSEEKRVKYLRSGGIYHLSFDQALKILNNKKSVV